MNPPATKCYEACPAWLFSGWELWTTEIQLQFLDPCCEQAFPEILHIDS